MLRTVMTNTATSNFVSHRKREFSVISQNNNILFLSLAIAISLLQHAESFLLQRAPQTSCRSPILQSTKSNGGSESRPNITSMPYFVSPGEDDFATKKNDFPGQNKLHAATAITTTTATNTKEYIEKENETLMFPRLLKLASMHCASQALHAAIKLKIPDLMGTNTLSVEELARLIEASDNNDPRCNRDSLFRTLRLLATIDVVREERASDLETLQSASISSQPLFRCFRFSLTPLGKSLRTTDKPSMTSCVLHWMEEPLWDSWLELSDYIREGGGKDSTKLPFERANGGISSDYWYNKDDHPESLKHANDFVHLIHDYELQAVVNGLDWSYYKNQRLVDVGGNNGKLAEAIAESEPTLQCFCLDLPSVIENVPSNKAPKNVKLIPGNVLDPGTIPDCEVILMKHFCDRCMWSEGETVDILKSCKSVLQRSSRNLPPSKKKKTTRNKIVIADAVLPDCENINQANQLPLYLDALYMLVGRERQRTRFEWKALAERAGLVLSGVIDTGVPSCSLVVLEPKSDLSP